jgi:PadR family transcriptional regulator, regulatory protein PadR
MADSKSDVLQGTLDLMVLKTLESMGPLHGYGIARRIEQVGENGLSLNQGTISRAVTSRTATVDQS